MRETEWQEQVVELAHLCGWEHLHIRKTRGKGGKWTTSTNLVGWPDLQLMRPGQIIWAELKVPPNKLEPEQEVMLEFLRSLGVGEVYVWYPGDFDEVKTVLSRRSRG